MEILAAYDLTRSYRDAAEMCGVSHNTVRAYVKAREQGQQAPVSAKRGRKTDLYLEQIRTWVTQSRGKIRGDVVHEKLVALGYEGSIRTTRYAVAEAKQAYRRETARVHRPWTPEPGLWLQFDYGDGPMVNGVKTVLFCAWLAFSRFRIVVPLADKTMPSVFAALDRCFRLIGGVPTYVLTDNEKTVTTEHVAGIAVRNPQMVAFARYYSTVVHTCLPADPASKGGSENAVRVAKADLVPTEANLRADYGSFAQLEAACTAFMEEVNSRVHRATLEIPAQMLAAVEVPRLHPVPATPMTAAFGQVRKVPVNTPMITFDHARYSVPYTLMGDQVFARQHNEQVVIVHVGQTGPVEVARHDRTRAGVPAVIESHFPAPSAGALDRKIRPTNAAEEEFLAIGDGARLWLTEAAAAGVNKIRHKMERAVAVTTLYGTAEVDQGLGAAAVHQRFTHQDLVSIITNSTTTVASPATDQQLRTVTDQGQWLSQGTSAWSNFGAETVPTAETPSATEVNRDTDPQAEPREGAPK